MKIGSFATWFVMTSLSTTALLGCRSVRSEAGLPASAFYNNADHVVSNDRGAWFVVRSAGQARLPFVVVGEGTDRELFYAIWSGGRAARLMPVTPGAYALLDKSRDASPVMEWIASPADAKGLSDSVGWVGADSSVSWNTAPADGTPVALVRGKLSGQPSIGAWLAGSATVDKGKLKDIEADGEGPWIALPDGAVAPRPIRVATSGFELAAHPGIAVLRTDIIAAPDAGTTEFTMRPLALSAGGDALAIGGQGVATIALARPVLRDGVPFAITEFPTTVNASDADEVLLALRDVAAARYLRAVRMLSKVDSPKASALRLRIAELVAAAGYVDWARAELMDTAVGLGPDTAYYLGRSHLIAGDLERAGDFAARSRSGFLLWKDTAGLHGTGQALMLTSSIEARSGNLDSAYDFALDASVAFDASGDSMRAAAAELLAANLAIHRKDLASAVKAAALARSRFFHGKSSYFAAFAELALADIYLEGGDPAEAQKMAEYAKSRFEKLNSAVGANRALAALGRVQGAAERETALRQIQAALDGAQKLGDFVGVVDAASSLVALGGVPEESSATYGLVIAAGLARTEDAYVRDRAGRALVLLCGRGMLERLDQMPNAAPGDIAVAKRACANTVGDVVAGGLAPLIAQGWGVLRAGDKEKAASIARSVTREAAGEGVAPEVRASAGLFVAAATPESQPTLVDAALRDLETTVDPAKQADVLAGLARSVASRGEVAVADQVYRVAMSAAEASSQGELRRTLALERTRLLHGAGWLDAALEAARASSTIMSTAGPRSASGRLELIAIEADVLYLLQKSAQGDIVMAKLAGVTDASEEEQANAALFASRLAASRGDFSDAETQMQRADELGAGGFGLSLGFAHIAYERGAMREASTLFKQAQEAAASGGEKILAARGVGFTAQDIESHDAAVAVLKGLQTSAGAIGPDATVALIQVELAAGNADQVVKIATAAGADGVTSASQPVTALCVEAAAFAAANQPGAADRLARCILHSRGAVRANAELIAALTDTSDVAAKIRSARMSASTAPRLAERAKLVSEIGAGTSKSDAARLDKLELATAAAAQGDDAAKMAQAVERLVRFLLATGDGVAADLSLEAHHRAFYDAGDWGVGRLGVLRASVLLGKLQPVAALTLAQRTASETSALAPADAAELNWVVARSSALLGMSAAARRSLAAARVGASADLRPQLNAFASRLNGL